MSEAENPALTKDSNVSIDDIHRLIGASTPHFALQIRNRITKLIEPLAADDPARVLGEEEVRRLEQIAFNGETRGTQQQPDQRTLASLGS